MQDEMKTCTRCEQMLALDQFVRDKNKKDGRASLCKPCNRLRLKEFVANNREHVKEYRHRWGKKNSEALREKTKRWQQKCVAANILQPPPIPESKTCPRCGEAKHGSEFYASKHSKDGRMSHCKACMSEKQKQWRHDNPELAALKDKRRWSRLTDEEKALMTTRAMQWHKANLIQRRADRIKGHTRRMKDDPNYYWQFRIRSAVRLGLRGIRKSASTETLLGCSFEALRQHLESQFEPWMNWSNYGRGEGCWSIDHIVPVSAFDLTNPEQQKLCFHYSNHRPMRHVDNRKKAYVYRQEDLDALRKRVLTE